MMVLLATFGRGSRLTNQQRLATCFLGRYPLAGISQSASPNVLLLGCLRIASFLWATKKVVRV